MAQLTGSRARVRFELSHTDQITDLPPMQGSRPHPVDVVHARSDLFDTPVILTSDLHKDAQRVFESLANQLDARRWTVMSGGDMAGTASWGEDASPAAAYAFIVAHFASLHYVLGNHDETSPALEELTNPDDMPCQLDRSPRQVGGRRLCGVSGIIGKATRRNRLSADAYVAAVTAALGPTPNQSVLITHETPGDAGFDRRMGQPELTQVITTLSPLTHVFGHCHLFPVAVESGGTLWVNVDRRVVLLEPLSK